MAVGGARPSGAPPTAQSLVTQYTAAMTSIAQSSNSTEKKAGQASHVGRFAPTPSGPLHAGSLVAALGSFLDARAHEGRWLLRIDDLDQPRCPPGTGEGIIDMLLRHGLSFDGSPVWQSERLELYRQALADLEQTGHSYRCGCSRSQLKRLAQAGKIAQGLAGPIYPGTCRLHPPPAGEPAGIRFRVPAGRLALPDRRLGFIRQDPSAEMGDILLRRSDGPVAYHLANVMDDAEMGVSHVVRGADLADLTPVQVRLQEALGLPRPDYMHLPVLYGADGRKLSKSNQAEPLQAERAAENLEAAAKALGLPEATGRPIESKLDFWIEQWRAMHAITG